MAESTTKLRIFVASPGDALEERKRLEDVIKELNSGIAQTKGLMLEFVGWETDAWSGVGKDAQDVINQAIGRYDILVGIMWKRFGTPTKRAGSGTEEEFEQAYNLWLEYGRPHIMLYFNKAPFFPSSSDELEQVANVLNFKSKVADKGVLFWEYNGPNDFEKIVRQHLTKEIIRWEDNLKPVRPPMIVRLPLQFYQCLFNELETYITQFEQLQRDYDRELKGEQLVFTADFSEVHNYMYPYSSDSHRSSLNQYIFNTLENPFTLMPGGVGELLTDIERALPSSDAIEKDPLMLYENVARFISEFPTAMNNEDRIIELYGRAEAQLNEAWGELFDVVLHGVQHSALQAVRFLMNQGKLVPIQGIQQITQFPSDVRQRAQWVRSDLNALRPGKTRNNQVDTIDFAITWLLNIQELNRKKYFGIYTQSKMFMTACTARKELRWEDDYLVRGAQYFKFRTRLQELFSSLESKRSFVVKWTTTCKKLQREINNLIRVERELPELKEPSLILLDIYRQFDEECRIPLDYTGKVGKQESSAIREKASQLFKLLKETNEFKGRTGEAYEILKSYLRDLQNRLALFAPENVRTSDAKKYMNNLVKWLRSENLEEHTVDPTKSKEE